MPEYQGRLLLRKRVLPEIEAWIFTNPMEETITETIDVSGWSHVEDLLGESLERRDDIISLTIPPLDIRVLMLTGPA
jgi:hypothetical protein